MSKLSVLLPVHNEEEKIQDCLESIKWADEILVVDSFSTDSTLEIAKAYGARIIKHEYINSAKQKNWAIPQCTHEWVLQIDADERLDQQLQDEICGILKDPPEGVDGFLINFKHHILNKWVKGAGLYPEYHLRLFRRDVGRFQDREVDAHVVIPSVPVVLKNHILHFGVDSISQRLRPLDRYTRYESDEREKIGTRFSWGMILIKPIGVFLYYYIYKLGILEGMRGLIIAFLKTEFVFWTYAKLWEKKEKLKKL